MQTYKNQSFEQLLHSGRITEAIHLRIETLENRAQNTRTDLEASKLINGAAAVVGGVMTFGNPLLGLVAGVAAGMYGASLWLDFMKTRRLCPVPGVRRGALELFQGLNDQDSKEDPLEAVLGYLSPALAAEYEFLQVRELPFSAYLKAFPEAQRIAAYWVAVRHARNSPDRLPLISVEETTATFALLQPELYEGRSFAAAAPARSFAAAAPSFSVAPPPATVLQSPPAAAPPDDEEELEPWDEEEEEEAAESTLDVEAIAVADIQPEAPAFSPTGETHAQPAPPAIRVPAWKPAPAKPSEVQRSDDSCRILDEVVASTRSTVFASATGTGKSVSQGYILTQFSQRYPDAEVWAIGQKNDSYNGLREANRARLFDPMQPEEAFDVLEIVWEEFDKRRKAPESDRAAFKEKPVRLILSDWHSIWEAVNDSPFYKKNVKPKLSTIVTVGREMNVCLIVDTQSYNVKSLGLAEDANIRSNLNILCQGYVWQDEEGNERGDYAMIGNLLNNPYLVKDSAPLKAKFERLVPQSQAQKTPIIFTSIGKPRLELLPDLRKFKGEGSGFKTSPAPAAPAPAQSQPAAKPGHPTIDRLLAAVNQIADKLHRMPTDAELRAICLKVTGKTLNDRGLQILREAIENSDEATE